MRVGIVGCGEISRVHVQALQKSRSCNVVGACDLIEDKAKSLAARYGIPRAYTDFSEMLRNEKLEMVDITTPPQVHEHLAVEAMNAGCHVLTEKPMCMTVQEADRMIEASKQNNVKLGVVHSFLFNPAIRRALIGVKKGEIGNLLWVDTVISINSLLKWKDVPGFPKWYYSLSGGLFGEIIPHGIYVQLAFLGNIRKAFGVARRNGKESKLVPFTDLHVTMDCENGTGGLFISTRMLTPHTLVNVRVVGSEGMYYINVPAATVVKAKLQTSDSISARTSMNIGPASRMIYDTLRLGVKTISGSIKPHMSHNTLIREFVERVQNGREPPVTSEEGKEVVRAEEMVWKSILD